MRVNTRAGQLLSDSIAVRLVSERFNKTTSVKFVWERCFSWSSRTCSKRHERWLTLRWDDSVDKHNSSLFEIWHPTPQDNNPTTELSLTLCTRSLKIFISLPIIASIVSTLAPAPAQNKLNHISVQQSLARVAPCLIYISADSTGIIGPVIDLSTRISYKPHLNNLLTCAHYKWHFRAS